ncbi:site-specific DNA-methyltransferase [Aliarcobacter butzleri]|uniref:site-specific DNA-methyltransferase n=1 Tax=Aliarcobacter butzleri TaxID=28197 RepID=UPI0021B1FBEF|nr:site-specific DNA-methyltransferase [Aliarcobacter butzleri]MCT7597262.1 site-specific DNA-methyltransferase [Aliarcobacter butzleri]
MSLEKNVIEEQSINEVNYELLKKQFPHALSIDENGKYVIDPQKLQMSLDPSLAQIKEDGYGLNWVGKKEAYHNAFTKNYKVLKPLKDDSKNWDETENIIIKGDNLDALKILRHNYFESIKMIYIDPPYNTKNDGFIYNDNFTTSTERTLEELGYDKEYIDYIENIQGAKTHSGWLSFMYPRLLLAFDLLKDDGVIFISIDENEMAQLKILCDEIFGEENFVECICWNKRIPKNDKGIGNIHEYILLYVKDSSKKYEFLMLKEGLDEIDELLKKLKANQVPIAEAENEIKKLYKKNAYDRGITLYNSLNENYRLWGKINMSWPNQDTFGPDYKILHPKTNIPVKIPDRGWRWKLDTFNNAAKIINGVYTEIKELHDGSFMCGDIWFAKDENTQPSSIKYLDEVNHFLLRSILSIKSDGGVELEKLFDGKSYFSRPKSTSLIKTLISSVQMEFNDIILDFFAGSGTTAHAIMELNLQDNTNRKYILVQLSELINETKNKVAFDFVKGLRQIKYPNIKEEELLKKYPPVIFDITKARIDKAGEQIAKGDIGFRTFEIVEDQKQKIYQKSLEEINQDDLLSLMEKPDISSNEEILYNLFVAETLPLSTKHQELIKDKLYLASNVAFILGDITSDELVEALKDKKECEYITVYSPNISNDKFTLEIESNISKLGIKSDKLRFRG